MLKQYGLTTHDTSKGHLKVVLEPPSDKPGWMVKEVIHDGKTVRCVVLWEREIVSEPLETLQGMAALMEGWSPEELDRYAKTGEEPARPQTKETEPSTEDE